MVVPVVNVPGLVHHSSQPIGLKNCFEPRQSKKNHGMNLVQVHVHVHVLENGV